MTSAAIESRQRRGCMQTRRHEIAHFQNQNAALPAKTSVQPFAPLRQLDPQRRRERAVEADADAEVVLQAVEARDALRSRRDLAGVVEQRHVEPSRFGIQRHSPDISMAVAIAEAPAAVAAQRAAAAERRQQEVRHAVVVVERRLQQAAAARAPSSRAGSGCAARPRRRGGRSCRCRRRRRSCGT